VDLDHTLYALDSTTIDLCLSLFPWARFRTHKGAVKMHTLLDLHGNIPAFIRITDGKVHDINILDQILPEAGAFYVMDRAYVDFERLYAFTLSSAFFVVRSKANVLLERRYSHPSDKSTGVRSDQTVILTSIHSAKAYPDALRRVSYCDAETGKWLKFLTTNFALPALTIAQIYKQRGQVELFFKWITQHLRIKAFYGTSENAVKTHIWIAVSVYVLVAIVHTRLWTIAPRRNSLLGAAVEKTAMRLPWKTLRVSHFPTARRRLGSQRNTTTHQPRCLSHSLELHSPQICR
jgi:transposase